MKDQTPGLFDASAPQPKPEPSEIYRLEFDGACEPNPGVMQIGFVIRDPAGRIVSEVSRKLGDGTNNIAEYQALIHGLRAALDLGIENLDVQGDSLIVVTATNGRGKPIHKRHPNIQPLLREVRALLPRFRHIEIRHVPREFNTHADDLSTA
jgi:ribonuclease HI